MNSQHGQKSLYERIVTTFLFVGAIVASQIVAAPSVWAFKKKQVDAVGQLTGTAKVAEGIRYEKDKVIFYKNGRKKREIQIGDKVFWKKKVKTESDFDSSSIKGSKESFKKLSVELKKKRDRGEKSPGLHLLHADSIEAVTSNGGKALVVRKQSTELVTSETNDKFNDAGVGSNYKTTIDVLDSEGNSKGSFECSGCEIVGISDSGSKVLILKNVHELFLGDPKGNLVNLGTIEKALFGFSQNEKFVAQCDYRTLRVFDLEEKKLSWSTPVQRKFFGKGLLSIQVADTGQEVTVEAGISEKFQFKR